jgi:6-phosphofructokinase 2
VTDIVTITINPAIDVFVNTRHVEPTSKVRCSAPKRDPGGGGINVARVASRLGADVVAIYPAGGSLGRLLHKLLERENVKSLITPAHRETRENFTVFEEETGEQYRFVLPGSPLHPAEWQACLDTLRDIDPHPRFVVASGSIPPAVPQDFFVHVARIAKEHGAKLILDTSGRGLKLALQEGANIIKPNLAELSDLAGESLDTEQRKIDACRRIIGAGQADTVALTLGADGAMLVTKDAIWRAAPLEVNVVSAVGAGDSFVGGLVAALAGGQPLARAFTTAMAAAYAAVLRPGTELCREEDVAELIRRIGITRIDSDARAEAR